MFGDSKEYYFIINPISVDGTIENVLDDEFKTLEKVKQFLKEK
tara:strand:+ start:107 stop:235 length:129 start_codon:yes stop_codon:yes gene_type:complete